MPGKGKGKEKGPNNTPPGWDKGNKTGWQGEEVPPGLARKGRRRSPGEETAQVTSQQESDLGDGQAQSAADTTL
jgi:hypothetical protein